MKKILTTKHLFVFFISPCIACTSCKKDSTGDQSGGTNTVKLLTASPWNLTKIERQQTVSGKLITQPSSSQTITFLDNNTFSSGGSSTGSGTCQLSGDKTQITIYNTAKGESGTLTIETLSSTSLQLTAPLTDTYTSDYSDLNHLLLTYFNKERATYSQ